MNQISGERIDTCSQGSEQSNKKNSLNATATGAPPEKKNDCRVQVAVRVRPFISKELADCEASCVKTTQNKIVVGTDKEFEFDQVINQDSSQEHVYDWCMRELLGKSFEGYNATVLAYGQTGSGKTFTMGTSNMNLNDHYEMGIIPRVIREIFSIRKEKENTVEMVLKISYFEIYNDNIIDLLDPNTIAGTSASSQGGNSKKSKGQVNAQNNVFIREEPDGSINLYGITEEKVNSPEEMLAALERGGLCRSTSATLMNQTSSRSHAVFTIFLEQHSLEGLYQRGDDNYMTGVQDAKGNKIEDMEAMVNEGFKTSKFHFVDLAGSERIKKTGAVGNTLREGININMGLLSLGNVISALTEPQRSGASKKHIPYRDSKLTRILQDSLGGNSNTLMIACVSPAESNFEESLNTLKYASRARRIKNKPVVNRDPQSALISSLKQQVQEAHHEISKLRQLLTSNNIKIPDFTNELQALAINETRRMGVPQDLLMLKQGMTQGNSTVLSMNMINEVDNEELKQLRINQVKLERKVKEFQAENGQLKSSSYKGEIDILTMQKERDNFRLKLEKLAEMVKEKGIFGTEGTMEVEQEIQQGNTFDYIQIDTNQRSLVDEYTLKVEKLKKELQQKDVEYREIQIEFEDGIKASLRDQQMLIEREKKIAVLTRKLKNAELEMIKAKSDAAAAKVLQKAEKKINLGDDNAMEEEEDDTIEMQVEDDETDIGVDADDLWKDPEFVKAESLLKMEENQQKWRLSKVDGSINETSERMRKLNQDQLVMQQQLLDKMKEQYHSKINTLESDMRRMENQRDEALFKLSSTNTKEAIAEKQRVIENFKQKVTDMQTVLNDFKRKAREQETLQKTVQSQEKQILTLGNEISKFKQNKTNLYKEMKKNNEEFEKFKLKKYKDLMVEKKKNIEKEKQIFKLQNQTKKQERLLMKKQEDIKRLVRSRDLIKKIMSSSSSGSTGGILTARGARAHNRSIRPLLFDEIPLNSTLNPQNGGQLSSDVMIDQTLDACLCKLIESIEINFTIQKAEEEIKITLQELEDAQHKSIEFKLALEKKDRELNESSNMVWKKNREESINPLNEELIEVQHVQLEQQRMELEEMQSRLESLECKYEFKKGKIAELYSDQRSSTFEGLQNELLTSPKFNNLTTLKILLKNLLERFGSSSTELLLNQEKIEALQVQLEDAQQFIQIVLNQKDICVMQMQAQIDALNVQNNLLQPSTLPGQSDSDSDLNHTQDENMQSQIGNQGEDNLFSHRRLNKNKGSPPKQIASNRYKSMRIAYQSDQSPFKKDQPKNEEQIKLQLKQIHDLTKSHKQNEIRLKTLQNRNETLQQKYDDLKKATCKDKFIGISKNNTDEELLLLNGSSNGTLLQQPANGVINSQQSAFNCTVQTAQALNNSLPNSQNTTGFHLNFNGLPTSQQQPQQQIPNSARIPKELTGIISLKERRREAKDRGSDANVCVTIPGNANAVGIDQLGQPLQQQSIQNISEDTSLLQQYSMLDRVTNTEGISSKAKSIHSINFIHKRAMLSEARQKQHHQNSQSIQLGDENMRGRVYSLQQTLPIDISENNTVNRMLDFNQTTQSDITFMNTLGSISESPFKPPEAYTNYILAGFSPAESQDLTEYQLQQIQQQNGMAKIISDGCSTGINGGIGTPPNPLLQMDNVRGDLSSSFGQGLSNPNSFGNGGLLSRNSTENSNNGSLQAQSIEDNVLWKYECVGKIGDAHTGQVFCVQSHENFLFSTSVKNLKIWDLETLKCISDIQAHTHFVKGLAIVEQEKWIATACDKYINIWDMVSLQKICTLTGHNVDIKHLYVDGGHVLYSAGKGTSTFGALVTWDIRKQQVIDEREKSQDIFSVLPYNNIIYYASRDHYVRRISMETNQSIDPFKPPHYDAVTSLAILNGHLVSGSKDHNLKLWPTNPLHISFKNQTYYSDDQVMCLESNKDHNLLYVGRKDGKIKVLTTQNNKFKDLCDINSLGLQSVNCISRVQSSLNENMFVCGQADKAIKIWKPTQESQQNFMALKYQSNTSQDISYQMESE